jgi:hypothetical protein
VFAPTIRYEIHDVRRFDRVQQFASYVRLEQRFCKGKAFRSSRTRGNRHEVTDGLPGREGERLPARSPSAAAREPQ